MMLAADVHLGTKNCDFQMERYVWKLKWQNVVDLQGFRGRHQGSSLLQCRAVPCRHGLPLVIIISLFLLVVAVEGNKAFPFYCISFGHSKNPWEKRFPPFFVSFGHNSTQGELHFPPFFLFCCCFCNHLFFLFWLQQQLGGALVSCVFLSQQQQGGTLLPFFHYLFQ